MNANDVKKQYTSSIPSISYMKCLRKVEKGEKYQHFIYEMLVYVKRVGEAKKGRISTFHI